MNIQEMGNNIESQPKDTKTVMADPEENSKTEPKVEKCPPTKEMEKKSEESM